jgi:hypothetical protein
MLQAGRRAPEFAQETRVDAGRLLVALRQNLVGDALVDVGLLIAIESTGDTSPEDPPFDLRLHLIAEREAAGVNAASLFNPQLVAGEAEAGPKAEATEIEPARFVRRGTLAAVGELEKEIRVAANHAERPTGAAEAEELFELGGELFRG